jgi:hypothetical protein
MTWFTISLSQFSSRFRLVGTLSCSTSGYLIIPAFFFFFFLTYINAPKHNLKCLGWFAVIAELRLFVFISWFPTSALHFMKHEGSQVIVTYSSGFLVMGLQHHINEITEIFYGGLITFPRLVQRGNLG